MRRVRPSSNRRFQLRTTSTNAMGRGIPPSRRVSIHTDATRRLPPSRRVSIYIDATRRGNPSRRVSIHTDATRRGNPSRRIYIHTDTTRRGFPALVVFPSTQTTHRRDEKGFSPSRRVREGVFPFSLCFYPQRRDEKGETLSRRIYIHTTHRHDEKGFPPFSSCFYPQRRDEKGETLSRRYIQGYYTQTRREGLSTLLVVFLSSICTDATRRGSPSSFVINKFFDRPFVGPDRELN
jgi:hypothetical protein